MDMADQFARTYALGLRTGKPARGNDPDKGRKRKGNTGDDPNKDGNGDKGAGKGPDEDKGTKDKGMPKYGRCVYCDGPHLVKECPYVPAERKKWKFSQHKKARKRDGVFKPSTGSKTGPTPGSPHPAGKKVLKTVTLESETGHPGGAKQKFVKTNGDAPRGGKESNHAGADGHATVGGVPGFYLCDGGCDRATIGPAFAKELEKNGVEVFNYDKPKPAKLADGTVKDLVKGFCVADVEVHTKAGAVILSRTHIDVLIGPESQNLIYLGQAEERRLNFKSFAEQLECVASKASKAGKGVVRVSPNGELEIETQVPCVTQVQRNGVSFYRFKRGAVVANPKSRPVADDPEIRPVTSDGQAYVGQKNWKTLTSTPYVFEPLAQECYVTTAALTGSEEQSGQKLPANGVGILDLDRPIKDWLEIGGLMGRYVAEVVVSLRVLPDDNRDTVRRLTNVKNVVCRVVESDKPALIIGRSIHEHLLERRNEDVEIPGTAEIDAAAIEHRLDEMLDEARTNGMSAAGLKCAEEVVKERFRNIWRIKLRPDDVADVPPLKIELEGDEEFRLPRPYRRRYTPAEIKFWQTKIKELVASKVVRPTSFGQLSPSNLVGKKRDGVPLPNDPRIVVDMRGVNKRVRPLHFALPKLDTLVHHLGGSTCFAKGDNTSGYWQVNLEEASRKFTAFDCPVGPHEHCRMPMGYINAGAWFQYCLEGVLKPMLWKKLLQYLDDTLLHAKTERLLLEALVEYFELLDKHNIKLHPGKFTLFAKKLTWCGKDVSADGVRPAEHRVSTVRSMPEPENLAQMMSYIYGVAWYRNHIPRFAEIAAPLYDLWRDALAPYKRKTTANAKKFKLNDLPGWHVKGRAAYEAVKAAFANAITTSFFDPEKKTCVFGDANEEFWCLAISQCVLPWRRETTLGRARGEA